MQNQIKKLNGIIKKKLNGNIYFFGAGKIGRHAKEQLSAYGADLEAFVDNKQSIQNTYVTGIAVRNIEWLRQNMKDEDVVVITTVHKEEIAEQLEGLGINHYIGYEENLFSYADRYNELLVDEYLPGFEKALLWVKKHSVENGGISYGSVNTVSYPEVSGYLIPTLMDYGMEELCIKIAKWLLRIQREDGGFAGPDQSDREYVFDTGQILRGFLRMRDEESIKDEIYRGIENCCEYLYANMCQQGEKGFVKQYGEEEQIPIPETILLYVLPPLKEAAEFLGRKDILKGVYNCLSYYKNHPDLMNLNYISHFVGYEMEALIDMGETDCVEPMLDYYEAMLKRLGYIEATKQVNWVCTPGMIQIGICFYKTGKAALGNQILDWIEELQSETGGYRGSHGRGAIYLENEEISWAVKFYLDANKLRIKEHFRSTADDVEIYPLTMDKDDPRYVYIHQHLADGNKIVEAGCGNGRILKNILQDFPNTSLYGIDISKEMIDKLPNEITGIQNEMEKISLESDFCDVVLCVEALEHSVNRERAIREMHRILRDGGCCLIIDKDKSNWGRLKCEKWEDWLEPEATAALLKKYFKKVDMVNISSSKGMNDNLFLGIAAYK